MPDGDCLLCGDTFTNRGMTRHLRSCLAEQPAATDRPAVHLRLSSAHRTAYWLHVVVEQATTLATLDDFLRDIWVECCTHMSSFTVGDTEYVKPYLEDEQPVGFGVDRRSMDVQLASVLAAVSDEEFEYEYDFGTPTELSIRVVDTGRWAVGARDGQSDADVSDSYAGIALLARNQPPAIECGSCGEPAAKVCQTCLRTRGPDAWLCEDCAAAHEDACDRPMYLPRVNSPRTGVCGYRG